MGLSAQQLLQNDPDYLRRQMQQQEMQRLNPTGGAAGAIGAMLGRGLGNVASGRGFFDTQDPALQRVAQTQAIYNRVMSEFDPENPTPSWAALTKAFSDAGLAGPAQLAQQEYAKALQQQREMGLRERQVTATERNVDITERRTDAEIEREQKAADLRERQLQLEIDKEARLGRYTDAQIKELNSRIAKGDKKIVAGKDQFGATIFYETDEQSGTVRPIVPQGSGVAPAAGPASGLPGNLTPAQISAELDRRRKAQGK
jgi:hypothetical protein